jgi:hypothetical protein
MQAAGIKSIFAKITAKFIMKKVISCSGPKAETS